MEVATEEAAIRVSLLNRAYQNLTLINLEFLLHLT